MKKFIAGLIIGLMLTSTVSFAANHDISAVLTDFNFVVNGQAKTLTTQPIVYNGTSYLPVRELSNMLGYDVIYDTISRTISLNNQPYPESIPCQNNSNSLNMLDANELYDKYGIGFAFGGIDGDPVTLTYNGKSIQTTDYVMIDLIIYFDKSILDFFDINQ